VNAFTAACGRSTLLRPGLLLRYARVEEPREREGRREISRHVIGAAPVDEEQKRKRAKRIVLSFDDGPDLESTPRILDILAGRGIKALFFVVGRRIQGGEELRLVERAHAEGHVIGNHTFSHAKLTELTDEQIRAELRRTRDVIGPWMGEPALFRPPYGETDERVDAIARAEGYVPVPWIVDTLDYHPDIGKDGAWIAHTMAEIASRRYSHLLLHDRPTTAAHLEEMLTRIAALPRSRFLRYC
jgi:peptidoglycan/xylan/chitin deacetylase (PgdA/CDA1 family)